MSSNLWMIVRQWASLSMSQAFWMRQRTPSLVSTRTSGQPKMCIQSNNQWYSKKLSLSLRTSKSLQIHHSTTRPHTIRFHSNTSKWWLLCPSHRSPALLWSHSRWLSKRGLWLLNQTFKTRIISPRTFKTKQFSRPATLQSYMCN